MKFLDPSRDNEEPVDELDLWSLANWERVHPMIRSDCEDYLLSQIPADVLANWKDQRSRGISIGSDDIFFHLGVGMHVRNTLREQFLDEELPEVAVSHTGQPYGPTKNWDDYYQGVLISICSR